MIMELVEGHLILPSLVSETYSHQLAMHPPYQQESTQWTRLPQYYNYETIENLDIATYRRVTIRAELGVRPR
jgi:hypothetical protein